MKFAIFLLIFLTIIGSFKSFSQLVLIRGKVIDKTNKKALSGVSVQIDKYKGTITNIKGVFVLQVDKALIKENGITITYIGYKKIKIPYTSNMPDYIEMELAENSLTEVIVNAKGKTIVEIAIEKITLNYPTKPIIVNGIMRVYNIVDDSDYFYKSDGIVQIYYPSYTNNKNSLGINLLQNKDTLIQNSQSKYFQDANKMRWVGGYNAIFDFVYKQPNFIKLGKLNKYKYVERDKSVFENRKVYVIDFFSKNNDKIEGTLYIDTATYAFVGAFFTIYNVKEPFFTPISIAKAQVCYQLIGGKWYIKNVHTEARHVSKYNSTYLTDFVFTSLDSINVKPFEYKDIIQPRDENIKIQKEGNKNNWAKYDSIFKKEELSNTISLISIPLLTKGNSKISKSTKEWSKFPGIILHYLFNNNIRYQVGLSRLPINISKIQPNLQKNISSIPNYSFGLNIQFRVYKELFLQIDGGNNFGAGGISNKTRGYNLIYNFDFNKKHHPITVSPVLGYNKITLFHKKTKYYVQQNLVAGLSLSYEITHKRSYFLAANYNHPISTNKYNNIVLLHITNFSPSVGVIFKL